MELELPAPKAGSTSDGARGARGDGVDGVNGISDLSLPDGGSCGIEKPAILHGLCDFVSSSEPLPLGLIMARTDIQTVSSLPQAHVVQQLANSCSARVRQQIV